MKSDKEKSNGLFLLESLAKIWMPAMKALEIKQTLGPLSLEESIAAAQRTGCEVCYADLPENVSGFAQVIAGQPYIVLNRRKSLHELKYTLLHELGHAVLHLNSSGADGRLGFPVEGRKGRKEIEAHLFAATWVLWTRNYQEQQEVLRQNPEAPLVLFVSAILSATTIAIVIVAHVWRKLSNPEAGK